LEGVCLEAGGGVVEACNGLDDDCDGVVPDDEADSDEDGVRVCAGDCNDLTGSIIPLERAWALGPTLPLAGHIGFRLSSLQSPADARETLMILRSIFESAGDSNGEEICEARLST
jgi:hypothetical protein